MKKRCFNGFVSLLLLLPTFRSPAQPFLFRTFSFKEGLNTYGINKTMQDEAGFIWIATQDGVYRFNGKSFELLKNDPRNLQSPSGNFFFDISQMRGGKLYAVDFNNGIDIIDPATLETERVNIHTGTRYNTQLPNLWLKNIFIDRLNNMWIGGKDFFAFRKNGSTAYTVVRQVPDGPAVLNINFIKPVWPDHVCISISGYGLLLYNIHTLRMDKLCATLAPGTIALQPDIKDIFQDSDTVFALTNHQLIKGRFEDSSWRYECSYDLRDLHQSAVNCLVKDRQNNIWIGTNGGLSRFTPSTGQILTLQASLTKKRWLQDNTINHLMIDNENNLWISTSKALQMMSLTHNGFRAFSGEEEGSEPMDHIYSIVPKDDSTFFSAGTDGLYLTDIRSGITKRVPGSNAVGIVHYVLQATAGLWIVSTDRGMYGYIPSSASFSQANLIKVFPEWRAYQNRYFNNSYRNGDVYYWASEEEEGLFKWDKQLHSITQFKAGTGRSGGLTENHLHNIKLDRDGYLWLLTDNTLEKFDLKKDSVIQILKDIRTGKAPSAGIFFDMYDDGRALWFGTYGGGLIGYEKRTSAWRQVTERDGLCNNSIYGILPESDSLLWLSTNMGLTQYNTYTGTCSNYYYEDGLQDNSFDEKGYLKYRNVLYFGGINGFTAIAPADIHKAPLFFPVYIYKLEYYQNAEKSTLHRIKWEETVLPAGTTTLSISVAALTFSYNHNIKFSYRIDGIQNDYIEAGDNNTITLNALTHGRYHVYIRFMSRGGHIVKEALQLDVVIAPKWYQTTWFKILVLLLFLGAIYVIYRFRIAQIRKEMKIRQEISRDLHDDIGGTLNSIKIYTNLVILDPTKKEYLPLIKNGAQAAISSTRDLMWVLDDRQDTLLDVVTRFEQFARPLASGNNIQLIKEMSTQLQTMQLKKQEKKNLFLILKEAFNNCIKYSGCDTFSCSLQLSKARKIIIIIKDNGRGFDDQSVLITGNGLKNMQYRAEQIAYSFSITSKKDGGTEIQLTQL